MKRIRIAVIGAGPLTEWSILPALSGPDVHSPPDSGAWWTRRPSANSDIQYQPPARAELVALAEADTIRRERVGGAARVRALYADWRAMLREVPCDAIVCAAPPDVAVKVLLACVGKPVALWLDGPPAPDAAQAAELEHRLPANRPRVWCARSLPQAAAHRVARRLIERDEIGSPLALCLRWGTPFDAAAPAAANGAVSAAAPSHFAATYAAFDWLLSFAPLTSAIRVMAGSAAGVTNVWLRCGNTNATSNWTATLLFAASEHWNAPLPRLEICGTQGRSMICEAGRRVWLHVPGEAARMWEPAGLAPQLSQSNLAGVAEDLKAFLIACADDNDAAFGKCAPDTKYFVSGNFAPGSGGLIQAARVLQLMKATARSLSEDAPIDARAGENAEEIEAPLQPSESAEPKVAVSHDLAPQRPAREPQADTLTLPLSL